MGNVQPRSTKSQADSSRFITYVPPPPPTISQCGPGTYVAPDKLSCIQCPANRYQPWNIAGSDRRGIEACQMCRVGEASDPGNTAETCDKCRPGYYSVNRQCTACPVNTFQPNTILKTDTSTVCQPCPTGSKTVTTGSAICTTDCTPGNYVLNGKCEPCPEGTFQGYSIPTTDTRGDTVCEKCPTGTTTLTKGSVSPLRCLTSTCSPGKYYDPTKAGSTSTNPDICLDCPVGTYQPASILLKNNKGLQDCLSCPSGTTSILKGASSCIQDPTCPPGRYFDEKGDCQPCPKKTYQPNTITKSKSSGIADCQACPIGQTSLFEGQSNCIPSRCPAGQYFREPDGACTPCPLDTYQDVTSLMIENGLGISKCKPCPSDTTTLDIGSTSASSCIPATCKPGLYVGPGNRCSPCSAGTYQPDTIKVKEKKDAGDSICLSCPSGQISIHPGSDKCMADSCPPGSFVFSNVCKPCPKNKYQPESIKIIGGITGDSVCKECPTGSQTSGEGSTTCDVCIPGFFNKNGKCEPCPVNTYKETAGPGSCQPCGLGTVAVNVGSSSCAPTFCKAGQWVL
jgi:hypothetical protein